MERINTPPPKRLEMDITKQEAQRLVRYLKRAGLLDDNAGQNSPDWPFQVGQAVMIRAVPLYYLGEVVRWTSKILVLKRASWVMDTGNFRQLWREPSASTYSYLPDAEVYVNLEGISDWAEWPHPLPVED